MKALIFLAIILALFGVVGRIDYECAQMSAHPATTYASTHNASK